MFEGMKYCHRCVSIHAFRGGRRRSRGGSRGGSLGVSIHAFRGGRRQMFCPRAHCFRSFNPRLPGGKATQDVADKGRIGQFQSTPSGGEGDGCTQRAWVVPWAVSIHAFRGGRRLYAACLGGAMGGFNPRLPGGKATCLWSGLIHRYPCFNPRLPGGKATSIAATDAIMARQFQSTPSGGEGDVLLPCGLTG